VLMVGPLFPVKRGFFFLAITLPLAPGSRDFLGLGTS
jgi:hypothetical protein